MKIIKANNALYEIISDDSLTIRKIATCRKGECCYHRIAAVEHSSEKTTEKVMSNAVVVDIDEAELDSYLERLSEEKLARLKAQRKQKSATDECLVVRLKTWLDEAMVDGVLPATYDNVRLLLRWLNEQNWGGWRLPQMSIAYSCNQYSTDRGGLATTIKLDEAIETPGGDVCRKFAVGARTAVPNEYMFMR